MKKFNKVKVAESFQKTRVKMHKSGKRWIRTIMSHVGLIHLFKGEEMNLTFKVIIWNEEEFQVPLSSRGLQH
ncbi:KxYKxGKxW signal peptide domain-containing protein [Streptococcus iniae]